MLSSCQISASIMRLLGSFSAADFLIIALLLIALLLAAILLSVFRFTINIMKNGPLIQGGCKLAWFGLTLWSADVSFQSLQDILQFFGKEEGERDRPEKEKSDEESDETSGKKDVRRNKTFKNPVDVVYSLADILIRLLSSLQLKRLSCCVCFGLNDPADTAKFCGCLYLISGALGLFFSKLSIIPWFHGERLEGDFMAEIEMRPILIIWAAIQSLRLKHTRMLLKGFLGWD